MSELSLAEPTLRRGLVLCGGLIELSFACHTGRVHSRPNRIALTRVEVREIIDHWQRQQALGWSAQDTEDVVEFPGRSRYRYGPVTSQLSTP